jgi:O-antigen chain-terminating methyltransferase
MAFLSAQEKIAIRLQCYLPANAGTPVWGDKFYCDHIQSPLGQAMESWKERLQQAGWLQRVKHIPVLGSSLQRFYQYLTRVRKKVATTELLKLESAEFINAMYRSILNRDPDPEGLQYLTKLLQAGADKRRLLYDFTRSQEAAALNVWLTQTDRKILKYQFKEFLKSLGLISKILNAAYKLWKLPQRFYALALTVQELQSRIETGENRLGGFEHITGNQQRQTSNDINAVREAQHKISERVKRIQGNLDNPDLRLKAAFHQEKTFRSIDYYLFEEKFRGTREVIKDRQRDYLGFIQTAWKQTGAEFLDVGCGRGEFLELLSEQKIPARGVDLDAKNVEFCQSRSMHVECADALGALQELKDNSLAGVVAFQVVEHLEPDYLNEFVLTAYEKTKPGGCVIFETVNPYSFYSLRSFYLDMSHKKPLPPETLKYLIEQAGFKDSRFHFICPVEQEQKLQGTDENTRKLNQMLFDYQGYAIIGVK